MWWKKNKLKIIIPCLIIAVLAAAFCFGGNAPNPGLPDNSATPTLPESTHTTPAPSPNAKDEAGATPAIDPAPEAEDDTTPGNTEDAESTGDEYYTEPIPTDTPLPIEPEESEGSSDEYSCTISISCATILDNLELCDSEKLELIPDDGWILAPTEASFTAGESVFDVLQRVCRENRIHMEFTTTPVYSSSYIEGINNIYEFDAGELSGWMYKVNEWFPNYGPSRYQLKDKDIVCWEYSCELGQDIGGGFISQADE